MENIANESQYDNIMIITLKAMQQYINFCKIRKDGANDLSVSNINMHFNDLLYMATALDKFAQTKNMDELYNAIVRQDTFVRDYYADTLGYMDGSDLYTEHPSVIKS